MKGYRLAAACLLLASVNAVYPQQWRKISEEPLPLSYSGCFISSSTGWAGGAYNTLIKTTDGGNSWSEQFRGSREEGSFIYSITFLNDNIGFAGGSEGTLVKTTNSGSSWSLIGTPSANKIKSLHFLDEQTGWILSATTDSASVYKTSDGGNSWTQVFNYAGKEVKTMRFYGNHGVLAGKNADIIYYTSDGDNWQKAPAPSLGGFSYSRSDIEAVYWLDENTVYAAGWGSTTGAQPTIFLKSTDGGANWQYITQAEENRTYATINSLYFKDNLNGLAGGGLSSTGTLLLRTTDGGNNWQRLKIPFGYSVNRISAYGNNVWLLCSASAVLYSPDFGDTWKQLSKTTSSSINVIKTTDGKNIFTGGDYGVFGKSTDGGKTWKTSNVYNGSLATTINDISFINNTGYTAQNFRIANKTTDAGETWTSVMADTNAAGVYNRAVCFLDENNGYIGGSFGSKTDIIYKTTNGGQSWSSVSGIMGGYVNCIEFTSYTNGVAGADDSKIYYTTDSGTNWLPAQLTDITTPLDVKALSFTDEMNGFAAGQNLLLRTSDGGKTWNTVTGFSPAGNVNDITFADGNNGCLVMDSYIYNTTDGGNTWLDVSDTLLTGKASLRSVCIDSSGYVWIAGYEGIIITNAPENPEVSVADNNKVLNFSLEQNYPNPFNPHTTISYNLDKRSRVTISLYDILGRKAATLFNGEKEAGRHTLNLDASGLASGIYICTMNADGRNKSIKMNLLK